MNILTFVNKVVGLWSLWLVLANLLRKLADPGANELLDHLLVIVLGLLGGRDLLLLNL